MATCLEKYIVKSSEFPPLYLGSLGRTVMDSKLFWIKKKSFFLFQSSSWNPPMLFLHQAANAQRGKVSNGVSRSLSALLSFPLGFGCWQVQGVCWWCWHNAVAPVANIPLLEAVLLLLTAPIQSMRLEGARKAITHYKYQGIRYGLRVHPYLSTMQGVQVAAPNTHVKELIMIQQPGSRRQGVWQTGHWEVTGHLGFSPRSTGHELLDIRQIAYVYDPLFSFYEMRIKIQENCQDLTRECI